ncbi:VOC family protein [Mycobacterium sp.]|uniref:VOC family protein n=1 Tax=Mycobacterium sp. TaxID=1785 RepID=UPI002D85AA2E|nr:VOC family protein [Mycobacterium sp.]
MRTQWSGLTVDCVDPVRLAAFWGALLDREPEPGLPGWMQLAARHDHEPRINFQPVPEPKRGKARTHLDITVDDIDSAVARVHDLGGRDTGERHEYPEGTVVVLHDPEGNEFCIVQYEPRAIKKADGEWRDLRRAALAGADAGDDRSIRE